MLRVLPPSLLAGLLLLVPAQDKTIQGAATPLRGASKEALKPTAMQARPEGSAVVDPFPRQKAIVKMIVNMEKVHRERATRLERLAQIYEKKGSIAQLRVAIQLRHTEEERYQATMRGYEQDLGPALYARVRAALDSGPGSPPPLRPIPDLPPPPPQLDPKPETPEQEAERNEAEGQEPQDGQKQDDGGTSRRGRDPRKGDDGQDGGR